MKVYFSVLKLRLINGLQYRVAALAGMVTQFFWGFMFIMIYEAFYSSAVEIMPIALDQLIAYVWLQQAFLVFVMLWYRDMELFNLITSGNIAYELCRPCGIYGFWYAKLLAQRLAGALLRCLPILITAFFLPKPYNLTLPPDLLTFVLFIVTLTLGLLILVSISMFIYISVFITMSPVGSLLMIGVFGEFLAGLIIPVPLMPLWLQKIVHLLPFRLTADLPFRIFTGHIVHDQALRAIFLQSAWLCLLIFLGNLALKKVLRRVIVQGG